MSKEKIEVGIGVDTEQLEDAIELISEADSVVPDITIRNNDVVNVTINNFNAPVDSEEEYTND